MSAKMYAKMYASTVNLSLALALAMALVLLGASAGAVAADAAAGKAKTEKTCAECHEAADWEGESEADIQAMIEDVVAGKVKHAKKIELSAQEIADIAAYWAAAKP